MNTTVTNFYSSDDVLSCPKLNIPEYAFIGRSNVGKSSLINLLLNKKVAYTSSKPGKTQLINHIIIDNNWALVDLPGYGYAKLSKEMRKKILKRTQKYFTERGAQLAGTFMLIDIRIKPQKIDLEWMEWLVQNKKVNNETTLFNWIESELSRGQLTIEASSISHIMKDLIDWKNNRDAQHKFVIEEWNSWLSSLRDSPDVRSQQTQMGESLLQLLIDLDHPLPDNEKKFIWPIAWAWAGLSWNLSTIEVMRF